MLAVIRKCICFACLVYFIRFKLYCSYFVWKLKHASSSRKQRYCVEFIPTLRNSVIIVCVVPKAVSKRRCEINRLKVNKYVTIAKAKTIYSQTEIQLLSS